MYAYGYSTYDNPSCSYTAFQVENVTIKNNILTAINFYHSTISSGGSCIAPPVQVSEAKNFNISQNTSDYISFVGGHCQNCTIASNILKNGITSIPVSGGSVASNNVCTVNCGMGSNNISNAIWINLFANSTPNTDEQFKLSPTSVAIGAGVGGIDAGAYGGALTDVDEEAFSVLSVCPHPCSTIVVLQSTADDYSTGTIIKETNATTGTIEATNKLTSTANVTYRVGKSITLNAGFKADNGVVFKTEFGRCNKNKSRSLIDSSCGFYYHEYFGNLS